MTVGGGDNGGRRKEICRGAVAHGGASGGDGSGNGAGVGKTKAGKDPGHPVFGRQRTVGRRAECGKRDLVGLPRAESGGTTYFVTFSTLPGLKLDRVERSWVMESIRWGEPKLWKVHGAVVMADHVHMLITPVGHTTEEPAEAGDGAAGDSADAGFGATVGSRAPTDLPERRWLSVGEIVKGIKNVTLRKVNKKRNRSGTIWIEGYHDRSVRDDADRRVKMSYMVNNPVKSGLVRDGREWDGLYIPG